MSETSLAAGAGITDCFPEAIGTHKKIRRKNKSKELPIVFFENFIKQYPAVK
tara:strand:+ start:3093 stop:3248 length:156 start_codon:yes stop_codon:yes gene_type:complete